MNGFRSDDDLRLVNERIHALHVDAARQRLVRRAAAPTSPATPHRSLGAALGWTGKQATQLARERREFAGQPALSDDSSVAAGCEAAPDMA